MHEFEQQEGHTRSPLKFIIGGILIAAAIVYLIASSVSASAQYFLTVEETLQKMEDGNLTNRNLRISGAVLGDSIQYDMESLDLRFSIAHVPGDQQLLEEEGGLAYALHNAVNDPDRAKIEVHYNGPIPDLLQDEAQAILTGQLGPEGDFYADEILLKCPTKYEGAVPEQSNKE